MSTMIKFNFHTNVTVSGKNVLKYLAQDIVEVYSKLPASGIAKPEAFDTLSDTEKAIAQLHATWNHPDNEVRNCIKLFAVRSPEILKLILES